MSDRPLIESRIVGGLLGDPAVYAFFPRTGAAALFDLGDVIGTLPTRDLLRVRLALISHTHIDHFIGFDRLLRVNIPHGRLIELCGPPGLAANVYGKLSGYTWNLVDPGQIRFRVREVAADGTLQSYMLVNDHRFVPQPEPSAVADPSPIPVANTLAAAPPASPIATFAAFDDGTRIDAVALDHGIPSIAYACQLGERHHVRPDALAAMGLTPGAWIRDLQLALADGAGLTRFSFGTQSYTAAELQRLLITTTRPRPLGYLTDAGFTPGNLARARRLFQSTDLLICETNYRDIDYRKARERLHLTTKQAALIAAAAGVKQLQIFHVSALYSHEAEAVVQEAAGFFGDFCRYTPPALEEAIAAEFSRL